jgi:phenylalanine-4-hydroxylase
MAKTAATTKYVSKAPDQNGFVDYTATEHQIWELLVKEQLPIVEQYACKDFLDGMEILRFSPNKIPQLPEVNQILRKTTGWEVSPVTALIGFAEFFNLLANRKFPAATFIRTLDELHYLQEPDIFHELFGHCPMLTNPVYADFMQKYGALGVNASHADRVMLARFYWFTVEFGLINTKQGLKAYGGGILSSIKETPYSIESVIPQRKTFDALEIFRTQYRIDILQTVYYVISNYQEIYDMLNTDVFAVINEARRLGMLQATYEKVAKL